MGVSDLLFGISDLPYSMAGIRIFAEEERKNRIVIMNRMIRDSTLSAGNFDHTPTIFFPLTTTGSLEIKESGISTTHLLERTFGIGVRK